MESGIALHPKIVRQMRHALGISDNKRSYRNYYSIDQSDDWDKLVLIGFATRHDKQNVYCVTDEGKKYLRDLGFDFK